MGLVAPQHVGSSQTRARTRVPCIGRRILNHCATRKSLSWRFWGLLWIGFLRPISKNLPATHIAHSSELWYGGGGGLFSDLGSSSQTGSYKGIEYWTSWRANGKKTNLKPNSTTGATHPIAQQGPHRTVTKISSSGFPAPGCRAQLQQWPVDGLEQVSRHAGPPFSSSITWGDGNDSHFTAL